MKLLKIKCLITFIIWTKPLFLLHTTYKDIKNTDQIFVLDKGQISYIGNDSR